MSKKDFSNAVKYLTNAANDLESPKDRYKACMLLGVAQEGQGSYAAARSAFYRAAENDPNKGEPYLRIAYLYMAAGTKPENRNSVFILKYREKLFI